MKVNKVKYLYEFPETDHDTSTKAFEISKYYNFDIHVIHGNELEIVIKNGKERESVYIVTRADGKIVHIDSTAQGFSKETLCPYSIACFIYMRKLFKENGFDMANGNYLDFYTAHFPKKEQGDDLPSIYEKRKTLKSERYTKWIIFVIAYEIIGLIFTLVFGFMLMNATFWITSAAIFIGVGLVALLINELLERNPDLFKKK